MKKIKKFFDRSEVLKSQRGAALIIFLVILTLLTAVAMGGLQVANLNFLASSSFQKGKTAFYSGELGLDLAINEIIDEFEHLSVYTTSSAHPGADSEGFISQIINDTTVKYKITNPVDKFLYQSVVGNSTLYHYAYTFDIESNSTASDGSTETLKETIRILETPLVQYYVFYGGTGDLADLEIDPGPPMESWGRIHANGDIYLTVPSSFKLRNYDDNGNLSPHFMSAGGVIYDKRKSGSSSSGPKQIKVSDTGTTFTPIETITGEINSTNETTEEARFNNFVLVNEQQYQVPGKTQFVRNGFYEQRAGNPERDTVDGIKIVGTGGLGTGNIEVYVSRPGSNTNVTTLVAAGESSTGNPVAGLPTPIIRETLNFHDDCREQRSVDTTDIDLYSLGLWYEAYLSDLGLSLAGDGVLIYVSRSPDPSFENSSGNLQAIRLMKINVTSLSELSDETTLTTDNPVYVQGDFNTSNTKGVAIVSDAFNILSNAYGNNQTTGKDCSSGYSNATNTTLYAAIFSGYTPVSVGSGTSSGGLHNYPRFLDIWSGKDCKIRGSIVIIWDSSQGDGTWYCCFPLYWPPNREWGWDVRFEDPTFWPPFIPSIFSIERVGFLE